MKSVLHQDRDTHRCDYGYRQKVILRRGKPAIGFYRLQYSPLKEAKKAGAPISFVRFRFGSVSFAEMSPEEARQVACELIVAAAECERKRVEDQVVAEIEKKTTTVILEDGEKVAK